MTRHNDKIDTIKKEIGVIIQNLRISGGKSRVEVAKAIGVSHQQLQKYERGKNVISIGRLITLAEYFGISINSLLEDVGTVNRNPVIKESRLSMELMRNFQMIKSRSHRYAVQQLVRNLANSDN